MLLYAQKYTSSLVGDHLNDVLCIQQCIITHGVSMTPQDYINSIRNPDKRLYSQEYLEYVANGGSAPSRGRLSVMAAQAVRMSIEEAIRSTQKGE